MDEEHGIDALMYEEHGIDALMYDEHAVSALMSVRRGMIVLIVQTELGVRYKKGELKWRRF